MALARSYLEVEQVRFGARLRVEEEIESDCEDCAVPALLLQPLVENAVKHGIAGLVEGGSIRLAVRRIGAAVAITVENGFDPEMPRALQDGHGARARPPPPSGPLRGRGRNGRRAGNVRPPRRPENGPRHHRHRRRTGRGVYRVVLRLPCESPMASSSRA